MRSEISPIVLFEILGLHGDRKICLNFDSPIKILVGENGSGKTTVLNILFNFLSGNWYKLHEYNFEKIRAVFPSKKELVITKEDFSGNTEVFFKSKLLRNFSDRWPNELILTTIDLLETNVSLFVIEKRLAQLGYKSNVTEKFLDELKLYYPDIRGQSNLRRAKPINDDFLEKSKLLKSYFPYPILYFPTYRRIEEDLRNLGFVEEKEFVRDEQLIQFGMVDVKKRFDRITSEIRDSSVEWYSIQNGKMLSQLIGGIQKESVDMKSLENPDVFRIVLDRIGENISKEDKEHILQLIASQQIKQEQYLHLAYFLLNLVQVYDRQSNNDDAIKNFARVTNQYLTGKEVRYNESKVDIQVVNKHSGIDMPLNRLSSGEKQVVSIFSRLFLEKSALPYAVLFDEPELSLSMEWQKKLLADIVSSGKCSFLLAATHSPFIFENDLDKYAKALKVEFEGEK